MSRNQGFVKSLCGLFGGIALFLSSSASGAVTFTNTPTTVSNTYSGFITLEIGGLTNNQSVLVQKYLDSVGNGVIAPGDLLVQEFPLTVGKAKVFSGVTNLFAAGDLNSSTGEITAEVLFQPASAGGDISQQLVGRYLYRLSSTNGAFTPITNSFIVTNFPFAQTISGIVRSNTLTVSNAVVILFTPGSGNNLNPQYGTVATNGNYSIAVPSGNYLAVALHTNYLANVAASPTLVISNNSVSTNLFLTNANQSISGTIEDSNTPSTTLPGIFVSANSSNNLIGVAFTDTNGNYTIGTVSNFWKLGLQNAPLDLHGYLSPQNSIKTNTESGSVSGVIFALPKQEAIFYGSVTDTNNNPLPGVLITSSDNIGDFEDNVGSDAQGNYFAGALTNGDWGIYIATSNPNYTNYIFSLPTVDQEGGTNFASSQACQANFTGIIATNTISGSVKDNNNNPITNVQVYASATIGSVTYQPAVNTDNNGNYSLPVANGSWNVTVFCGGGQNSLPSNYECPGSLMVNITNNNVVTNFVVQQCSGVSITTPSPLPVGEVNIYYDQFLYASSCYPSFSWTNTSGSSALPPGLNFGSNGELSGIPTTNGVFMFTAQVTDGNNDTTNQIFSVTINSAVQVTTTTLPNGTNGMMYSQQLQATGGQVFGGGSPYSWSLSPGSLSLPVNLSLGTNGVLSGILATNGTFNFSVRAADSVGDTSDQPLSLFIADTNLPPLTIGTVGGQVIVLWPASAGSNFALQMTTNLVTGPWVPATNGVQAISFLFTNNQHAVFYRLQ